MHSSKPNEVFIDPVSELASIKSNSLRRNSTIAYAILIFSVLGIIGCLIYIFMPKNFFSLSEMVSATTPTSSTKPASTTKEVSENVFEGSGIRLKYPKTWEKVENLNADTQLTIVRKENKIEVAELDFIAGKSKINLTFEEIRQLNELAGKKYGALISSEEIALAGARASKITALGKINDLNIKYIGINALKYDRIYIITYTANESKYDKYLIEAQAIIDSFEIPYE